MTRQGFVLWFTGLSGAGKSTLAAHVSATLRARGVPVEVLDGDEVRENLSKGLGFSKEDRDTNVRRIGFVANLLAQHGVCAVTAAISPYRAIRDECRAKSRVPFIEVHVEAPLAVVEARDTKGLYARARAGLVPQMTGLNDPYEPPENPEVVVHTGAETVAESAAKIVGYLETRRLV